jgi:hypothetical protein
MKMPLLVFLTCSLVTLSCAAQQTRNQGGPVPAYELYSWQDSKGEWRFSLLYNTNRQKTVQEVFNKKSVLHGSNGVKRRISQLSIPSEIVWFDRLTLSGVRLKGSEALKYPPKDIVDEITRYADAHGVKVSGPEER